MQHTKKRPPSRDQNDSGIPVQFESDLLSCLFQKPELVTQTRVLPEHFSTDNHRKIFTAMQRLKDFSLSEIREALGDLDGPFVDALYSSDKHLLRKFPVYERKVLQACRDRKFHLLLAQLGKAAAEERLPILQALQDLAVPIKDAVTVTCFSDIPDVFEGGIIEPVPAVEELGINQGTVTILVSEPKLGKSWLSLFLAVQVALGNGFLGKPTAEMKVLYLDKENPQAEVQKRLLTIAGGPVPSLKIWGHWHRDPPAMIGDPRLIAMAKAEHPLLIIIDSLVRFHSQDENDAKEMAEVSRLCRELADAGATLILIHHEGKNGVYRGSSDILAGCDQQFKLKKSEETGEMTLHLNANRSQASRVIRIRPDFAKGKFLPLELHAIPPAEQAEELSHLLQRIIRAHPGSTTNQLVAKSQRQRSTVIAILNGKEGNLWWKKQRGQACRYFPDPTGSDTGSEEKCQNQF